jgi:hypothetical protein
MAWAAASPSASGPAGAGTRVTEQTPGKRQRHHANKCPPAGWRSRVAGCAAGVLSLRSLRSFCALSALSLRSVCAHTGWRALPSARPGPCGRRELDGCARRVKSSQVRAAGAGGQGGASRLSTSLGRPAHLSSPARRPTATAVPVPQCPSPPPPAALCARCSARPAAQTRAAGWCASQAQRGSAGFHLCSNAGLVCARGHGMACRGTRARHRKQPAAASSSRQQPAAAAAQPNTGPSAQARRRPQTPWRPLLLPLARLPAVPCA